MNKDFERFKNRECRAKDIFSIQEITKPQAYEFVRKYHYLGDAKFFCVKAFGLFFDKTNELVGCATYSLPQGIDALKGWFSLGNSTKNIFELSRLCMLPELNGTNATSFLLGGSLKELNKQNSRERERGVISNLDHLHQTSGCAGQLSRWLWQKGMLVQYIKFVTSNILV